MTPLTGTKHTYVRLAIVIFSHFLLCFVNKNVPGLRTFMTELAKQ